jgi:hypothetical protein
MIKVVEVDDHPMRSAVDVLMNPPTMLPESDRAKITIEHTGTRWWVRIRRRGEMPVEYGEEQLTVLLSKLWVEAWAGRL